MTKKGSISISGHRIDHNVVEVLRGQGYICRHLGQSHSYVSPVVSLVYESVLCVLLVFYLLKEIVME